METCWKIISLGGIAVLYGLFLVGMKKYHIKDTIKRLTKKEKLVMAAGAGMLCLGLLMQAARMPSEALRGVNLPQGGVVTDSVDWITGILFAENITAMTLAVSVVILIPAVLYQVLFLEQLMMKCKIPYCQMYYFLMLYVFHAGLYRNLVATPGELLLLLVVSALLYYGMEVLGGTRSKKGILYLLCFLAGIGVLLVLEQPIHWQLYAVSGVAMAESVIMALFRGKSIILRKTLRKLGTLILFAGFVILNYWLPF